MRIIGGVCGRRQLRSVPGLTVRPASDRLREAIFNILAGRIEGRRVLDLFAGIGSLGLEALSRGAAWCEFVERDRRVYAALVENIQRLGFGERAVGRRGDVWAWARSQPEEAAWDLAFVDPPYALYRDPRRRRRLEELWAWVGQRLCTGGTLVASAPTDVALPSAPASLEADRARRYGQTWVCFWHRRGDPSRGTS